MAQIKISSKLKFILRILRFLPSTLLIFTIILIIILLILPFALYRRLLFYLGPKLNVHLDKMVNLAAIIYASGYKNPLSCEIVLELKIHGPFCLERFKKDFKEKILHRKNPQGVLYYPELSQIYTKFMGYLFWRDCSEFDFDEHFKFWRDFQKCDKLLEKTDLNSIRKQILLLDFLPGKPLWSWTIVEKPDFNETIAFFKISHAIGDGYSILQVLSKMFPIESNQEKVSEKSQKFEKNKKILDISGRKVQKFVQFFKILAKILYTPIKFTELLSISLFNRCEWAKNIEPGDFHLTSSEMPMAQSNFIKFDKIKEIANKRRNSPSNVILAAICGGIRQFLIINQIKIVNNPLFTIPIPTAFHPEKLRNNMFSLSIPFPLGIENPLTRLEVISKRRSRARNESFVVELEDFLFYYICNLPHIFFGPVFNLIAGGSNERAVVFPMFYSGFPGPKSVTYNGQPTDVVGFTVPAFTIGLPLLLTSVSNKNGLAFFGTGIKSAFKSDQSIQELLTFIENEFDILRDFKSYEYV